MAEQIWIDRNENESPLPKSVHPETSTRGRTGNWTLGLQKKARDANEGALEP